MSGLRRRLVGAERFDHLAHQPDETETSLVGPVWSTRGSYIISGALRPVRPGLPRFRSWRARLPEAAAVEEQVDAIIGPSVEVGLGHRWAEAGGAALRQSDGELEEPLGRECRAVDRQAAGARHNRGELGETLRRGYHQPVERERHRRQDGVQHQPRQAPQHLLIVTNIPINVAMPLATTGILSKRNATVTTMSCAACVIIAGSCHITTRKPAKPAIRNSRSTSDGQACPTTHDSASAAISQDVDDRHKARHGDVCRAEQRWAKTLQRPVARRVLDKPAAECGGGKGQ